MKLNILMLSQLIHTTFQQFRFETIFTSSDIKRNCEHIFSSVPVETRRLQQLCKMGIFNIGKIVVILSLVIFVVDSIPVSSRATNNDCEINGKEKLTISIKNEKKLNFHKSFESLTNMNF